MRKVLLSTTAAVAGMLIAATSHAVQITAGTSLFQDVTFTGDAAAGYVVTAPQPLTLQAFALPGHGGMAIFGLNFTTGPETGGIFTANANSETFFFSAHNDLLAGTIHVTQIQGDTVQPKIYFVCDAPSSIDGNSIFVTAFSNGGIGDWIMNSLGVTLTNLVGSAAATISSLEIIPASAVPEPAASSVIGCAFLFIGWLNRRFIRNNSIG